MAELAESINGTIAAAVLQLFNGAFIIFTSMLSAKPGSSFLGTLEYEI
ncbi:MAG: hypothetical protein OIN90_16545 [Candidatus Methanoperedens sp.]|nr:hypothetical protein [Candidatus Methanoperedens sp.]